MLLHFDVIEQTIMRQQRKHLVNYSKNYLYLSFSFNPTWNDLTKYIIFKKDENYLYELKYDSENELYVVGVPSHVLETDYFTFTIYGVKIKDNHEIRITTEDIRVKLHRSGYSYSIYGVPEEEGVTDIFTVLSNGLQEVNIKLNSKADKIHTHYTNDVVDFEASTDYDIERFLDNLTTSIRQM